MTVELYSQDSIFNAGLTSVQAITQLIDPVADTDVATKYYVDHAIDVLQTDPRFDTSVHPLTALPIATNEILGGVKIGRDLTVTLDGTLSLIPQNVLPLSGGTITGPLTLLSSVILPNNQIINSTTQPFLTGVLIATNTTAGVVKVGDGVFITNDGTISVTQFSGLSSTGGNVYGDVNVYGVLSAYELKGTLVNLPVASIDTVGCIRIGSNLYIDDESRLNTFAPFVLIPSTKTTLGGVIVGSGISVDSDGVISSNSLPLTGGVLTDALTGTKATFTTSLSSPALSGTHYGDGSKLTGVIAAGGSATDSTKLPLAGGTLNGPLRGLSATFTSYISAPAVSGTFYGDGSKLTGVPLYTPPAAATFSISVSSPSVSGGYFYGDGSRLTGLTTGNYLSSTGGTLSGSLIIKNNLTIQGNLTATGISTFINTTFTTTSALSVVNTSPASGIPALYIGQSGPSDIASFYDIDRGIEVLHVGGVNSLNPNVGIHTSTPNKTLTVNGEISAWNDIWTGGKFRGDGSLLTGISVGGTSDSTKLPLSGGTLSGNLYQGGTGYFYGDTLNLALRPPTGGSVYLQSNDGNSNWVLANSAGTTIYNFLTIGRQDGSQEGGQIGLCRSSDNTVNWNIDVYGAGTAPRLRIHKDLGGEKMTILDNGNVGIGTASPSNKLTVIGDMSIGGALNTGHGISTSDCQIEVGLLRTGSGSAYIDLHATAGTGYDARVFRAGGVDGNMYITNTGTGNFNIQQQGAGPIVFGITNKERMCLTTNGFLGIGTTTPNRLIEAVNTNEALDNATILAYNTSVSTGRTAGLWLQTGIPESIVYHTLYNSSTAKSTYQISPGAGVSLMSINMPAVVFRGATEGIRMSIVESGTYIYKSLTVGIQDNVNIGGNIGLARSKDGQTYWHMQVLGDTYTPRLRFFTQDFDEHATILANGNVGIGDSAPSRKLSVSGDIGFSGYIYGDGSKLTGISQGAVGNFIPTSGGSLTGTISGTNDAKIVFENNNIPATVTFAGNMLNTQGISDGIQTEASFNLPENMVKDLQGNIFIADTGAHTIRKITTNGTVTTIAGLGNSAGLTNGTGSAARFHSPKSIVIDSQSNLYVSDAYNRVIRKLTKEQDGTYTVSTFAGTAGIASIVNGTGSAARFVFPASMTIDSTDKIYVVDSNIGLASNLIRTITPQAVVSTFAGGGLDIYPNSTADACRLAYALHGGNRITLDSNNNVIYADNYRVIKITQSGIVSTIIGSNNSQVSHVYNAAATESTSTDLGNGLVIPTQLIYSIFIDKNNNDKLYIGSNNLLQTVERIGVSTTFNIRNVIARGVTASDTLLSYTKSGIIKTILKDVNNKLTYLDGTFNRVVKITNSQSSISATDGIITPVLRAGKLYGDGSGLASVFLKTGGQLEGNIYSTSEAFFGRVSVGTDSNLPQGAHIVAELNTEGKGDLTVTGKYSGDGSGLQNVLLLTGGTITGSVTINTNLTVNGKITAKGDISTEGDLVAFSTSDKNLKENITNIPNSLEKLTKINGVYFNWIDKPEFIGIDVGVIAQDVERVLPEIVTTRTNGYKAVQYDKLIPLLIESIKELKSQVDDLKEQLKNK